MADDSFIEGIWTVIYRELVADTTLISLIGADNIASNIKRTQQGTQINLSANDGIVFNIPDITRDTIYTPLRDCDVLISGISKTSDVNAVKLTKAVIDNLDGQKFQSETYIIINEINFLNYPDPVFFDNDINAYRSDVLFQVLGSPK